ncbi:MAG: hypothetical protein R3350_10940 [Saprospiraceae bacterium]|nr:hypothetical protein [Saprospiraceae bacterium]
MNRIWIYAIVLLFPAHLATGQIALSDEDPVAGEEVYLELPKPDSQVVLVYRPNSSLASTDTLVADSLRVRFAWRPTEAGVYTIRAGGQSRNVSVRFSGLSTSGILVMLIAGGILFGGVIFAFRILFRKEEKGGKIELDPSHQPDT